MNSVTLYGRLTADPNITSYVNQRGEQGLSARFNVACQRDKDTADFISCVAFGKTAEILQKFFFSGNRIVCRGRIQTGSYVNKNGQTVYTTDVLVNEVDFVETRADRVSAASPDTNYQQQQQYYQQPVQQPVQQPAPAKGKEKKTAAVPVAQAQPQNAMPMQQPQYQQTIQQQGGWAVIPDGVEDEGLPF